MSIRAAGPKLDDPRLSLGPSFFAYYQQVVDAEANAALSARFCKANPTIRYRMSKTFLPVRTPYRPILVQIRGQGAGGAHWRGAEWPNYPPVIYI